MIASRLITRIETPVNFCCFRCLYFSVVAVVSVAVVAAALLPMLLEMLLLLLQRFAAALLPMLLELLLFAAAQTPSSSAPRSLGSHAIKKKTPKSYGVYGWVVYKFPWVFIHHSGFSTGGV